MVFWLTTFSARYLRYLGRLLLGGGFGSAGVFSMEHSDRFTFIRSDVTYSTLGVNFYTCYRYVF